MKRLIIVLLCLTLAAVMSVTCFAVPTGKNVGTAAGTAAPMVLDGVKDPAYDTGLKLEGAPQKPEESSSAKVAFYVTYTADALWIFCEIADPTLVTKAADPAKPTWKVDCTEILLDLENKGENIPDVTPLQARIDHNDLVSARKGQQGTSLFLRKSEGGTCDFFDAKAVKTGSGFNAEYCFPIEGLKAGRQIGLNLCYMDWDKDDGTCVALGITSGVTSWQPDKYDYIVLGEVAKIETTAAAAAADAAAKPAAAAQTFDAAIIALIPAALSAAALVAIRKRK